MPDTSFDQLSEHFKKKIYDTTKGRVRLEVLWRDLQEIVPEIQSGQVINVLDAGCGMAQVSARLASLGHHLVLNDISQSMLDAACEELAQYDLKYEYKILHQPLQQLSENHYQEFDLVMNHAVLEWMESPQNAVVELIKLVKPDGYLSLMFYNIHSIVYRNLVRGNLRKVEQAEWAGTGEGSLTPINPLEPEDVIRWVQDAGLNIEMKSGVRVFQDYLPRDIRNQLSDDDIVKAEVEYSRKEPYLNLGRYIHLVCRKPKAERLM